MGLATFLSVPACCFGTFLSIHGGMVEDSSSIFRMNRPCILGGVLAEAFHGEEPPALLQALTALRVLGSGKGSAVAKSLGSDSDMLGAPSPCLAAPSLYELGRPLTCPWP